jgi:hypothetical protein
MPSVIDAAEAEGFSHDPNHSEGISNVTCDRTESGCEANAPSASVDAQDRASGAAPSNSGDPDEDLGAFDDSHLQHDEAKKKKRKKKSKPKSKRGLVIHFSASCCSLLS